MTISTCFVSAAALLALTAFTQKTSLKSSPTAFPSLRPATVKGTKALTKTTAVSDVVTAANAFIATLTTAQQATLLQTFNQTNVAKWSNLPCGAQCRLGLQLANLTTAQVTAAMAVVQAATGTTSGDGFNEVQQIRAADDNLGTQRSGYGNGIYFIAFLGTPSTTGTWMLQFGGHHLATNMTYSGGYVTGSTPKFEGVEPLNFTTTNANVLPMGTVCAPMANEASSMIAMLNGLTTAQKATAKLTQTFSDVVLGPGQDGNFPATRVGIQCSQLTSAQQALVVAAMAPWVQDTDDATAAALLAYYQTQLANTYISYSGTGTFNTNADYARIDGPNVWIEFVAQTGVVYNTQTHFHSIWRDRARDYGGNYYTTVTATKSETAASIFSVYPNPVATGLGLDVVLAKATPSATYTLRNMLGQTVASDLFTGTATKVSTVGLAAGTYILTVQPAGEPAVASRVTLQ
ncbi:MAG: DUF3500 domain-containing protein [Janthinobacterium lividum]